MLTFIKKTIKGNKRLYLLLLSIISLLATFEFIMLGFTTIKLPADEGLSYSMNFVGDKINTFLVLLLAIILSLVINNFFSNSKQEEFSIILLYGCKVKQIIFYVLVQFCLMYVIACVIGGLLGSLILSFISNQLNSSTILFSYDLISIIGLFIVITILKLLIICGLNYGNFTKITTDITRLLTHTSNETSKPSYALNKDKNKFPKGKLISSIIGIFLIGQGIYSILFVKEAPSTSYIAYYASALLGIIIILNSLIPLIKELTHEKKLMIDFKRLVSLNNFMDFKKALTSMIYLQIGVMSLGLLVVSSVSTEIVFVVTSIFSLFAAMVMLVLCLLLRFKLYLPTRINNYASLRSVGLTMKDVNTINAQELLYFAFLVIIIPLIVELSWVKVMINQKVIDSMLGISIIAVYIITSLGLLVYMHYQERGLVKEVYSDVKYINRGE